MVFRKSLFEFLKCLASTLNANASQSRKERVQKIARQAIEGFTDLLKIYITSVKDAYLDDEEILDSLTLFSWYIHRFWKSLLRHIFPLTELIADTFTQLLPKLPETLNYIYDSHCFSQNFVDITEKSSETIQKLTIIHHNIEIKNYNADTQPFNCKNIPENTNTSLEALPIENMATIVHSQQTDIHLNETTETDFISTLLDDGTLFSSHIVNTLINRESNDQNNNPKNNNNNVTSNTTNNTHIYQNHQHIKPVKSTELTQNSDPLKTTLPILLKVNTPYHVYTEKIQYISTLNQLF